MSFKKVVCYYGSWSVYRPGFGKLEVEDLNTDICTHLIYAFAGIETDGTVKSLDAYNDLTENYGKGNYVKFVALKQKNAQLKTFLAVGGYNEGSAKYSTMAASPTLRANFIKSGMDLLLKYKFDGLDLDWEYPNQRDSTNGKADVENFSQLLKELKEALSKHNLGLSVAVAAAKSSASMSYNIADVAKYVDFINLMTYDFAGTWDHKTGHHAGLFGGEGDQNKPVDELLTVEAAVKYWLGQGCPADKLVLGIPTYGRAFNLVDASSAGVGAPASGAGMSGPYTRENGMLGYNEICEKFKTESWVQKRDELAKVPYAVNGKNWVSYEDPKSISEKINFVNANNLAGAMIWSIETDDFKGVCGENYPLLRAINKGLGGSAQVSSTSSGNEIIVTTNTAAATTGGPLSPGNTVSSSQVPTQVPSNVCNGEGVTSNPEDCSSFYNCYYDIDGNLIPHLMYCTPGTVWDSTINTCNFEYEVSCKKTRSFKDSNEIEDTE